MAYPDDLSNLPANRTDWTGAPADAPATARVTAAAANAVETAINQIEDTLGLTPQGAAASVAARLAALDSTVAGKLATSGTAADAAAVGGVTVTGTPAAGQVLKATSTTAATWQADATGGGGGGAVTSVVGATGDVVGSQIVADAAVAAALAAKLGTGAGAVGTSNLADGAVTAAKVAPDVATQTELDAVAAAKANTVHAHSAADLTSGTLPLARGGTGGTDAAGARSNLGLGTAATQPATAFAPAAAVTAALSAPSTTTTGTLVAGQMALADATSAAITRTLPAANSVPAGTVTGIKKIDGSVNAVTVNRAGSDTITGTAVGQTSRVLTLAGESIELTSDGVSVWVITSTDTPSPSLIATYAPLALTGTALSAAVALAERDAATGVVPPRMTTPPTTYGPAKGSGITGTPTVSAGGAGYVVGDQITLAGGTFSVAAVLQVATVTSGAVATVTVVRNGMYSATPANTVAQASTTGSGTGATFTVSWSANGQSISLTRQAIGPTDSRFRFTGNGPSNLSASGFYGNTVGNGTHSSWEWATNSQRVDIPLIGLQTKGILYVDGRQVSGVDVTTDSSGVQYLYAIDNGSAGWRNYRWLGYNNAFGGVRIDATATLTAPLVQPRPLWWSIGDSYTAGSGVENAASMHIVVMGDILGVDILPDGIGGSGWNTAAPNTPAERITAKLSTLTRQVDYVSFDLGLNDAGGNMTTAATSWDAAYAAAKASPRVGPATKYFCFGPATPVGETGNLDLVRDMLVARCTAAGDVRFVDVRNWVNAANKSMYTGVDNVHPSPLGHKYLGARRAVAVAPYL